MNESEFKSYLKENGLEENQITIYINLLKDYEVYLSNAKLDFEINGPDKIVEYSEGLVSKDKKTVLNFLNAILYYANYSKIHEFTTKVIDISESYNAMDNLYSRVAEIHGDKIRDEIFEGLTVPPLGVHPEKKPEFTKIILKRLEEKLGIEKTVDLLSPCLHGRPPDDIDGDKKLLKDLGIDAFLKKKHQDLIIRLEKHRDEGTLEFAQPIDDGTIQYVRDHPSIAQGLREGNIIYVSKVPYQMREFLDAKDDNLKRFFLCYCPWVRGAFKDGTDNELSKEFCNCSAGWYKLYWDQIFEHPVKVEPVKTGLNGDLECTFAIHIPDNILKTITKK